jgi:hypothetical protein
MSETNKGKAMLGKFESYMRKHQHADLARGDFKYPHWRVYNSAETQIAFDCFKAGWHAHHEIVGEFINDFVTPPLTEQSS